MTGMTIAYLSSDWTAPSKQRLEALRAAAAPDVDVIGVDSTSPDGEVIEQLAAATVIAPWLAEATPALARACPRLKLVQLFSAGYDAHDIRGLADLGIALANNGGANAVSVAEHTIALMLDLYRNLSAAWESTRSGRWRDGVAHLPFRREIGGKIIGIVGFGNIGRQVARRLSGFDVELLAYDPVELPPGRDLELGARAVSLDALLSASDIVSLHVPFIPGTRHLIGAPQLALMKPDAVLINACRGSVVDEAALVLALQEKRIAGAGLDVFEQEPTPPDNPLLSMPNVIATPHWAGGTQEGMQRAVEFTVSNARRLADGKPPLSVVPPDA